MNSKTVAEVLNWFEDMQDNANVKQATAVEAVRLRKLFKERFGGLPLGECRPFHLVNFIMSPCCRGNPIRRGCRIRVTICRPFLLAAEVGFIDRNPFEGAKLRFVRRLPKTLTGDEPARLLAAIYKPHHRLMAKLGLYLGLRISEILNLRVEELDLERGMCQVRCGKGDKDRAVPIPAKLLPELRAWCAGREGLLFASPRRSGRPICARTVQKMIRSAALRAGIFRKVTPHV